MEIIVGIIIGIVIGTTGTLLYMKKLWEGEKNESKRISASD